MTKADARRERFEQVEVLGKNVLFTELRVDRDTVPEGLRCYELRHTDADWSEPCELARGIMVNFMGTILTSDPYQLPPEGWLPVSGRTFEYTDEPSITAQEFLAEHPPTGMDVIDLYTIAEDKHDLLFSKGEAADLKNGCIGHLRGDFGSGKQFYTTWWPHQNDCLNTEPFKADIDRVVNWLRGETGPLHDFSAMERFCRMHERSAAVPEAMLKSYGFSIDTRQYQYMLRCTPVKGDYNFYLYCYDKDARERARTLPKKNITHAPKKKRSEPER
ncbi:MAG: hypothetical protein IJV64_08490 [Oscillospiraceae bacterium]|nr:hypothetical protein [Oscillospiraceae bacterium]